MQRVVISAQVSWTSWFRCGVGAGLAVLLLLAGSASTAHAAELCVNPGGSGGCYTTIQAAVSAAVSGDTIRIAAGTYDNGTIAVTDKNLSFIGDGADRTWIDGGGASRVFSANASSAIELSNLRVQNGYSASGHGGGIYAQGALTLTNVDVLSNTVVAVNQNGGGIYAGKTLLMTNCRVINNQANWKGGGIYVAGAVTLTTVDIMTNTVVNTIFGTEGLGGGLYAEGSLTLIDTDVISNTSVSTGAGVFAATSSTVDVTRGRFEHNVSLLGSKNGGGLYLSNSSSRLAITGTEFISNTGYLGGAVATNGSAVVTGALFQDNYANQTAGLYIYGNAVVTDTNFLSNTTGIYTGLYTSTGTAGAYVIGNADITGGRFEGNASGARMEGYGCTTCSGGALSVNKNSTISGTVFVNNSALAGGGAVYQRFNSTTTQLTVTNATFTGNVCTNADCRGGAVGVNAPVAMVDTDFYSNTGGLGSGTGGGFAAVAGATISGGVFRYNTAYNGGALSSGVATANFVISGTEFVGNTSLMTSTNGGGGAFYFIPNAGSTAVLTNVHASDNSAYAGGAIYAGKAITITGGEFQNNRAVNGGALSMVVNSPARVVISGTKFISNTGTGTGGGAFYLSTTSAAATAILTNVLATNNSAPAGGAFYVNRPITITGGVFDNNRANNGSGGALFATDIMSVTGAQILSNSATDNGGGIYQQSYAGTIINSLFAGNGAGNLGDGYYRANANTNHPIRILNSTFVTPTETSGEAIYISNGWRVMITNTLVASYTTGIQNASGNVTQDYNLFTGVTTPTVGSVGGGTHSVSSTDVRFLDPGAGNYRLLTGSPAAGKGTNVGVLVDLDGAARADPPSIGAFEGIPAPGGLSLVKIASPTTVVDFQGTVVYTLTLANTGAQLEPNVIVTDVLPTGATFKEWIQKPTGAENSSGAITWTGAVTDTAEITFVFAVTNTASGGATITNTARFSGTERADNAVAIYTTTADCYAASSGNWSEVFNACAAGAKRIIPAGVTVNLDINVTITGDFEVRPGATFNANGKTMTLTGSNTQTLTGNPLSFYMLVINKNNKSDVVRITGKLSVTKKLTIAKGSLVSASEYGDLEIEELGVLTLTNPISITGSFTNSGELNTEGNAVNFIGGLVQPVEQNLVLNVMTWFDDLNVVTDTTVVEVVTDDNAIVQGALTNHGTLRKTQAVAATEAYYFGLAGAYDGAVLEIDAVVTGSLSALQVDRIDASPASAPGVTPLYWRITPSGASYNVTLTLPHAGVTDPSACRRVAGSIWDCAASRSDATTVTRQNLTEFSEWGVFSMHPTTTTLTSQLTPSTYGQSITFTATVSTITQGAGTPTGVVTFSIGAGEYTATLASGIASYATSSLSVGSHVVTATYRGDLDFVGSRSEPLTQTINSVGTTTALVSAPNPSAFGQSAIFTATVSAATPGAVAPTGAVTFTAGATTLGTVNLTGGVASISSAGLDIGSYDVTAAYGGDAGFGASLSPTHTHVVERTAVAVLFAPSPNPATYGESVSTAVTVTAQHVLPAGFLGIERQSGPSGVITLYDGVDLVTTAVLVDGAATASWSLPATGAHTLTVTYGGDDRHAAGASQPGALTVNRAGTTSALTTPSAATIFGEPMTFTITVHTALLQGMGGGLTPALPTGQVQLKDGSTVIGAGTLTDGVAPLNVSLLAGGTHTLTAEYAGDANYLASAAPAVNHTVTPAATQTSLTAAPNPSRQYDPVILTATVQAAPFAPGATAAQGSPAALTGQVQFYNGAAPLDTVTLASGVAVLTRGDLPSGVVTLTAVYLGDTNYAGSTSAAVQQVIAPMPVAKNDAAGVLQGQAVMIDPLANDLDPAGGGLTVTAVGQAGHGVAAIDPGARTVTYTPDQSFSGVDSFTYTMQDINRYVDDAVVAVVVTARSETGEAPLVEVVDNTAGSNLTFPDGGAQVGVQLPPGSYSGTLETRDILYLAYTPVLTPTADTGQQPGGMRFGNLVFDMSLYLNSAQLEGFVFPQPITVIISYNPALLFGLDEATLSLLYWDGATWSSEGIVLVSRDLNAHTLTVLLAHLSEYAFFATPSTPTALDPEPEPALVPLKLFLPAVMSAPPDVTGQASDTTGGLETQH